MLVYLLVYRRCPWQKRQHLQASQTEMRLPRRPAVAMPPDRAVAAELEKQGTTISYMTINRMRARLRLKG